MSPHFAKVCSDEDDQIMEMPLEEDGTLLLSTVTTLFPLCSGLKYKSPESNTWRTLKCVEGKIYPPQDGNWEAFVFHSMMPRENKRKVVGGVAEDDLTSPYNKAGQDKRQCSDIIVLGIAWKSDENTLREYFSQYGELAMVQLKRNPTTGQSKGFGFIRFVDYNAQVACLSERHYIDGRWCEVKIPDSKLYADKQEVVRKVYVGGVTEHVTLDTLREVFSHYGAVTDVYIPKPFRNFAFVTFADHNVAQSLLGKSVPCGQLQLNIQAAAPKLPPNSRMANHYQHSHHHGFQPHRHADFYGQHASDQNAITLAALNMLKTPGVLNTLIGLQQAAAASNHHPQNRLPPHQALSYLGHHNSNSQPPDPFNRSSKFM